MSAYLNPENLKNEVYGWLPSRLSRYAVRKLLGAHTKIMQVKYCPSPEPQKRSAAFQLLIQTQLTRRDLSSHSHPEWLAQQTYRLMGPDEADRQLKIFDLYEYATLAIYFCCDDDFRELRPEKNCSEMMDELYKALIFVDDPYAYYQQHAVFHTISEQALRCCLYLESEISSDDVFESQKIITQCS